MGKIWVYFLEMNKIIIIQFEFNFIRMKGMHNTKNNEIKANTLLK